MSDKSIYEKGHQTREDQKNAFAFGRITRVFPDERLCEVKTFMGVGQTDDNHIPKCQWLNSDAHPDGDESTVLPRVGSYGIVFYIDSEPFVFGFFSPLTGTGSAQLGDGKEELNEGDRIMITRGGNKVILRAHGEIQIESTNTCRTIYFPDRNLINTLCRNYEFRTDGGTIDWQNIDANNNTLFRQEFRDNINRANLVVEEVGYIDGGEFIHRRVLGAGSPAGVSEPVWSEELKTSGEWTRFIRSPGAEFGSKINVTPDGTTTLEVGGKATVIVSPSGDISLDTRGKVSMQVDGKLSVQVGGDVSAVSGGKMSLEGSGGKAVLSGGKVALGAGDEVLDLFSQLLEALGQETHPTPLGPSGPPINASIYAGIKSKLDAIKGSL